MRNKQEPQSAPHCASENPSRISKCGPTDRYPNLFSFLSMPQSSIVHPSYLHPLTMNNNWPPDSLPSKGPTHSVRGSVTTRRKRRTGRKWTLGISVPITQRRIVLRWFCSPFWWVGRKVVASSSGSGGK